MKIDIHTEYQSGGTNIGQLNTPQKSQQDTWFSKVRDGFLEHVGQIIATLLFLGVGAGSLLINNQNKMPDTFNVHSENQSGGVTAGQVNIFTDKETLGIREPLGLYKDGKHVGDVVEQGIHIDENQKIFTFEKITFDKPLPNSDPSYVFNVFEFGKYIIQITHANSVTVMMPPGAEKVQGRILDIKN